MLINTPTLDYMTVTTSSDTLAAEWYQNYNLGNDDDEIHRRFNYKGNQWYEHGGTWFLGHGTQENANHYMFVASGSAANVMLERVGSDLASGSCACTRLDVQITLDKPDWWKQSRLIVMCEELGMKPCVERSDGLQEELISVYTGTRASGRMNRTYQKEDSDKNQFIRFETEFSREYAKSLAVTLYRGGVTCREVINGEVRRRRDVNMYEVFFTGDGTYYPKANRKKSLGKTDKWLLQTIAPFIKKYVNSHDKNTDVVKALREAIGDD